MADELLVTKLFIPPQGPRNLPRERLFALLDRGLSPENHLTLVCAPAGYGKTALIADWVHRLAATPGAPAVAWLSLDESDNDPAVFFAYLAASLRTVLPAAAEIAHRLLHAPQATSPRAAFAGLANELTQSGAGVVLVLDDYHLIRTPAIHDELAYWIDHLPPNARLLVATRSDPPFPLHRFRGRGQMVEIRMDELRFSPEEVAGFMRPFSGDELGREEIEILAERTEGWIAGIQMAALSLRGKENKAQFIQSLAGSNRFILDYLAEEVIRDQPAEVKRFLLQSSILNRLCGPLCDALMDSEAGSESGQAMLERLESENLFLIPLDEERYWYRYHHLFADLLRLRLQQAARGEPGPGAVEQLHRRAAGWLAAAGWHAEAIQHFITAGDFEQAAGLVERHTLRLFAQGELHRLLGWIRLLPPDLAARRPRLSVFQAWTLVFAGRLGEVDAALRPVEAAIAAGETAADERRRLQGDLIAIRGMAALTAGDLPGAAALMNLPEDAIPPDRPFARSVAAWVTGYIWRMRGNLPAAIAAFDEALQLGRQMDNVWSIHSAAVDLGEVLRQSGRLGEAETVYRQTLAIIEHAESPNPGFLGRLKSFLAAILLEKNELAAAEDLALAAVELNRRWQNPNHTAFGGLVLARVALARADFAAAQDALAWVDETLAHQAVMPHLHTAAQVTRLRLWLAQGRLADAAGWAAAQALDAPFNEEALARALGVVRVKRAAGDLAGARALLAQLEADARAGLKLNALIEILVLRALCAAEETDASEALGEAVALGVPAGCRRVFVQEGEPLRKRLVDLRARAGRKGAPLDAARLLEPVETLLDAFDSAGPAAGERAETPLTDREIEILACMAEGLSNQEIGRRLYIAAGTVKAHSAAIYRKLDVANRSAAVSAAKDRGLI